MKRNNISKLIDPQGHPYCRLCRDGTYATMSLQTHESPGWERSAYCTPCGEAMASVLRESYQKRDPEIQTLVPPEEPPEAVEVPPAPPPSPAVTPPKTVKRGGKPPVPPPVAAPVAAKPTSRLVPTAKTVGGYDLLSMLGIK